jgi:hypothetical protein
MKKTRLSLLMLLFIALLCACDAVNVTLPGANTTLYRDEFVQGFTGNWQLENDDLGSTVIVPEQLLIELNTPNLVQYATLEEPTFSDFALEVEAGLQNGSAASTYGVLFRMQGPEEFYRFAITGDGMYLLERHDSGGAVVRFTEDWRSAAAINQGRGSTNKLTVVADGSRIAVYINDVMLEAITDDVYRAGKIALSAGTFDGAGTQVSFDNLTVYPPQ